METIYQRTLTTKGPWSTEVDYFWAATIGVWPRYSVMTLYPYTGKQSPVGDGKSNGYFIPRST